MNDGIAQPTFAGVSPLTVQELPRNVSKLGELFLSDAEIREFRGANLTNAEVVALYVYVRDVSRRLEEEWRDEFVDLFPNQAHVLPAPRT
jgi:hypothetical protein